MHKDMTAKSKMIVRDSLRLLGAILFAVFYVPHMCAYVLKRFNIDRDLEVIKRCHITLNLPNWLACVYLLHNDSFFRSYFYYRIGPVLSLLIGWWRPGDKYFILSSTMKIGQGFRFFHPYATVLNAESIGDNFSCMHLTTLGDKKGGKPIIGNNVHLGANVSVIGPVRIGDNVEIGAGSVVVKDIPSNSIAVGNPAKVVKSNSAKT